MRLLKILTLVMLSGAAQMHVQFWSQNKAPCVPASGTMHSYTTTFPKAETPMYQCNSWLQGEADGTNWINIDTIVGQAYSDKFQGTVGGSNFDDPTAELKGTWSPDVMVQGTFFGTNKTDAGSEEVELRTRTTITSGSITGYEWDAIPNKATAANCSFDIGRWNGPVGNFNSITTGASPDFSTSGATACMTTGDVLTGQSIGTVHTAYINNNFVAEGVDSGAGSFSSGNPGMGMEVLCQSCGATLNLTDVGWTKYTVNDTPISVTSTCSADLTTSGTTVNCLVGTTTTGDCIGVFAFWNSQTATGSVSGSVSGSFTPIGTPTNGAGGLGSYRAQAFYNCGVTGGSDTITLTTSLTTTDRALAVMDMHNITALDQSTAVKSINATAGTSNTTGTTAGAGILMAGCVQSGADPGDAGTPSWIENEHTNFEGNNFSTRIVFVPATFQFSTATSTAQDFLCTIDAFKK